MLDSAAPGDRVVTGLSVANLILEPSTRTRCSFELAEQRLKIERVTVSEGSSLLKGETLVDTARTLAAMGVNAFVLRHPDVGAPDDLASAMPNAHVVNAGDGTGEHPTQALLDLLTLRRHWGSVEGRTVLIVGDIVHSRVARSNYHGLMALGGSVVFCGPQSFLPSLDEFPGVTLNSDLDVALEDCDAVMMLRIQRERLTDRENCPDTETFRKQYGLTVNRLTRLRDDVPVLHPGPFNRGVEIDGAVADSERALIWPQVTAGVAIRMGLLARLSEIRRELGLASS